MIYLIGTLRLFTVISVSDIVSYGNKQNLISYYINW